MEESMAIPSVLLEGSSPVPEEEEALESLPVPLPLASPERSDMDQHKFRANEEKFIISDLYTYLLLLKNN